MNLELRILNNKIKIRDGRFGNVSPLKGGGR